jgi:cation diffusion facilitator family transporter
VAHGLLAWFGLHDHDHGRDRRDDHTHVRHNHGIVHATIATTKRGIWVIKWSFVILALTAALQSLIVVASGSVALLADMVHNIGDAATAIPLGIAFWFARRTPTPTFTYGFGRVEDLAGIAVVLVVLASALFAGMETVDRFVHPHLMTMPTGVAAAGAVGILGNALVARLRIRVGQEINSAALVADGYHARIDSLTSLAVVAGALAVALGYPAADALVGMLITVMIFWIVWQSAKAVFVRLLDGVDPGIADELRHVALEHVPGISGIANIQTRWVGHRLHAQADILVDDSIPVRDGVAVAELLQRTAREHMPALASLSVALAIATGRHGPTPPSRSDRSEDPN